MYVFWPIPVLSSPDSCKRQAAHGTSHGAAAGAASDNTPYPADSSMIIRQVVPRIWLSRRRPARPPFPLCADKVSVGNFLAGIPGDYLGSAYVRRKANKRIGPQLSLAPPRFDSNRRDDSLTRADAFFSLAFRLKTAVEQL